MNHDAVTTCTNLECEVEGVKLVGFVVDDGARWWVWARDEDDARMLVAESMATQGQDPLVEYERAMGQSLYEAWTCPLTDEAMAGITFSDDDDGTTRPMADEMRSSQRRGIVASSEW